MMTSGSSFVVLTETHPGPSVAFFDGVGGSEKQPDIVTSATSRQHQIESRVRWDRMVRQP